MKGPDRTGEVFYTTKTDIRKWFLYPLCLPYSHNTPESKVDVGNGRDTVITWVWCGSIRKGKKMTTGSPSAVPPIFLYGRKDKDVPALFSFTYPRQEKSRLTAVRLQA